MAHILEIDFAARADHLVRHGVVVVHLQDHGQLVEVDRVRHVERDKVVPPIPVGIFATVVVSQCLRFCNLSRILAVQVRGRTARGRGDSGDRGGRDCIVVFERNCALRKQVLGTPACFNA